MDPGLGDSTRLDTEPFETVRLKSRGIRLLSEEVRVRARVTRHQVRAGRSQRTILHESAYARLQAKMGTMAVIEQAKGIIMAQQLCGPEQAFDLLRQMSQRTNVKAHVLAEQIVRQIAASNDAGNVTPISVGTRRYRRTWRGGAQPSPVDPG